MTCFTCDTLVPDGAKNCPRCGAKLVLDGTQNNAIPWNRGVIQPRDYGEEKRQFALEAKDSIRKTFFVRIGQTIIYTCLFVLALITLTSSTYFIYEHDFIFNDLPTIFSALNIVLWVLLLIRLSDLKGYEERFGTALRYAALVMLFSLASLFLTGSLVGLLISIGGLVSGVLFMYHYCGSFSDLTGMVDEDISRKWELMLRIFLVETVLRLGGLLFLYFSIKNAGSVYQMLSAVNNTLLWSFIFALLELLVMIIEIIIFLKTIKHFENRS